MKNKIYISLILSIFAFVFLFGLASALNINIAPSSIELSPYDNSKELTIINEDNENFDISLSTDTLIVGNVQVDILNTTELNNVSIAKIKISVDSEEIEENIDFGEFFENSFTLTIKDRENSSISDTQEISIKLSNNKFCDEENPADLDIRIKSIDVIKGFGDDDEYWYPLDEIEIEIEVSDPEYDVEDIEIEFCLYDLEENECILDEDDIEISKDDFDLDEGDKIKTILSFKVDPEELTSGNKDYRIYIKAIGEIDDKNYEGDEETCVSVYEDIEIVTDDEFVIIDNIVLNKEIFQCGEELRITADVWNIGDEELEDDEIFVRVYNKDLEIDEKIEFIRGIDEMDKEELDLIFKIPKEIEEKFYVIDMYVYDDEDMYANDIYENSEDDKAEYFVSVKVEGNCVKEIEDQVVVFANLESAANAGEKMIVKATVMNLGDDSSIYAINVANYAGWAYSATLDKTIFNLEKGSSEDVLITLDIKEDAYGSKSFDIELVLDEQVVLKQPITVSIESNSEGIFGGLIENMKDNALLWSIGILNVILVLAIIIVAIKLIVKS
jgi:hypothetical protein